MIVPAQVAADAVSPAARAVIERLMFISRLAAVKSRAIHRTEAESMAAPYKPPRKRFLPNRVALCPRQSAKRYRT